MYETIEVGSKYTENYSVYITKDKKVISPWHDIPQKTFTTITCINEIPRFENAKFEMSTKIGMNPIKQDIKKGMPRFVSNIFPLKGYPWNYGAIPQTWEDPNKLDMLCKAKGDNDPLDIIEIGTKCKKIGEVYEAKVLGALALIDDGECDWKIIVMDVNDKYADAYNDIKDVWEYRRDLLEYTKIFFRDYKIPDGKDKNIFALDGNYMDRMCAMEVIKECHESWKNLMKGETKAGLENATLIDTKGVVSEFVISGVAEADGPVPDKVHEFYYCN